MKHTAARGKSHNTAKSPFYTSVSILFRGVSKYYYSLSVCTSICLWCVCVFVLCESVLVCCLGILLMGGCVVFQIRPSDGGFGFTLEERNRVPIIKSVEKGSPAEVRTHI